VLGPLAAAAILGSLLQGVLDVGGRLLGEGVVLVLDFGDDVVGLVLYFGDKVAGFVLGEGVGESIGGAEADQEYY
jgi:hypothetical protein